MNLELQDHVVVVTGGGSGIGLATARMFAEEGARVALLDVAPAVRDVAAELSERTGLDVRGYVVDIADESAVQEAADQVRREIGPVEHVIHCAAIGSGRFGFPFTNLAPADWRRVLEVNVMGMVHVAHAFAAPMQERGQGTFVFLASVAGQIGSQTDPPYSASKAANINFAQCLARDLAPAGVRVNTVCPGMVQTPLNESVWKAWHDQQPEGERLPYADWALHKIRQIVPLGRWQTPDDVAAMALFLSSDRARNVTGQTINVDGGFVMHC